MKKRFLSIVFPSLLIGLFPGLVSAEIEKPNVILIMADDMGYECLSCNGSKSYRTPNLDRLAQEGIRFEHTYSQPLCTPSRVKIMTGQYNFRNYEEFGYLNPKEKTFGHVMQKAGYRTCIAGKWQLNGIYHGAQGNQDPTLPLKAGFHESCLWQVTQGKGKGERYADPLIEKNGKLLPKLKGEYGPQVFADFICDFIRQNKDQPFFVYYPMVLTHDPFVATPDSPEWNQPGRYTKNNVFFADMVRYTDKIVGQIDQVLKDSGIRENTILMFTGDNGTHRSLSSDMKDGRSITGGKGTTPNAGTHVPFIVSWPGHAPTGKVNRDLIDFSDFFSTLSEIANAPTQASQSDGISFLPQLKGEKGKPRDYMFCHYDPRWGNFTKQRGRFARDQVYKLYMDGRMYHVPGDVLEKQQLNPKDLNSARARERLKQVLNSMPAWNPPPPLPKKQ